MHPPEPRQTPAHESIERLNAGERVLQPQHGHETPFFVPARYETLAVFAHTDVDLPHPGHSSHPLFGEDDLDGEEAARPGRRSGSRPTKPCRLALITLEETHLDNARATRHYTPPVA